MHENQLFLGRNAIKKLDFVLFLEKSCISQYFGNPYKQRCYKTKKNRILLRDLCASGWA